MDGQDRSDEDLTRQLADGNEAAFAELYRRYFARIYDFALRLTRDRDTAALVLQVAFLRAYQAVRAGEPAPFRLHLFAAAHYDAMERLRRQRGLVLEGEEAFVTLDPGRIAQPALAAELPDLARLAWQIYRDVKPDDYELIDLSIRQQFDPAEIAAILRTRPESVETRLARLRGAFEEAFSSLVLLRRGRRACLDLDFLVGDADWSASVRRSIQRHLQSCQTCQATRRRFPSAGELLAAMAPVPAPAGWQETILDRLQNAARTGVMAATPAPAVTPVATPPPARRPAPVASAPSPAPLGPGIGERLGDFFAGGGARGPLVAVLGGGLLFVVIIVGALCASGAFDGGSGLDATATPTATTTRTVTGTATPTGTPTPTSTPLPLPPTETPTATSVPPSPTPVPPSPTRPPPTPTRPPPTPTSPPPPTATPAP
jgi:RNA polymerase sigma factor (sigma-70 family)